MTSSNLRRLALLLALLAISTAHAQQPTAPSLNARPLYGNEGRAAAVDSSVAHSTDPRVLAVTERLKATVGEVRAANPAVVPAPRRDAASRALLRRGGNNPVAIRMRHNTGTPRFIEGPALEAAVVGSRAATVGDDISTARNFLQAKRELLRLTDPSRELKLESHARDALARRHLRFAQQYNGIPVWPAEVGVHVEEGGNVYLMTGAYVPTPAIAQTTPAIGRDDAILRARIHLPGAAHGSNTEPELIIYAPGEQTPRLAWKLALIPSAPEHWIVVVDAQNGRILTKFNQICYANVAGSGVDVGGQVRPLNVWEQNGSYFLTDTSKPMFDATSQPPSAATTRGGIIIQDARNQPPGDNPGRPDAVFDIVSTNPNSFAPAEAVSAAFNLSAAYDYFLERHNRNSLDGNGTSILAIVRYGQNFDNAFWNGQFIALGDGDTWANSLDFVGHELAHAVTETSANLVYQFQSGALNESFSDIFGEMIEHRSFGNNDWLLGSGLRTALRNMMNPGALTFGGRPYPSKMTEFFNLSADVDAGGVHVNSSIPNRCFYLLAEGLQGGIGRADAEKIFYRALTVYLMRNSQFIDARLACVRAARDLFGDNSTQAQRTAAAFDAVEIFDNQPTPPPQDFPEVQAEDSTLFLYGDSFNGFLLARREANQNDPAEGRFLGANFASPRPPAVNGAGDLGVYVTADNDLALFRTDGGGEEKLGFAGVVHAVGMAPDGAKFGFVLRDQNGQPDNRISVIDIAANTTQTYDLLAPATDAGTVATILHADAMAFTADGRFLVYDALNSITLANGTQMAVFSIYALELATGKINPLVSPFEGFNIGNPSLSNTNDGFMIFEAIRLGDGRSFILTSNLSTGTVVEVAQSLTLAYPCFTGDDTAFVFADVTNNTVTGTTLYRRALAEDRQTPVGNAAVWVGDGGYPFIYRRGAFQGPPAPQPNRLANISTRGVVGAGDDVLIGGFIVQGTGAKRVIVRAIGPSLPVSGALANPTLAVFNGEQEVASNDNWESNQRQEIVDTGIPPVNPNESAIVTSLNPGAYTVVMRGAGGGTGVGLVEIYDLDGGTDSKLVNISTRGSIGTGENVMIGGFIVQGEVPRRVIVRAIGPSLNASGVQGAVQDTALQLFSGDNLLNENDNWRIGGQEQEITGTTIAPSDDREAAIVATLVPGAYTVVAKGAGDTTGVGLVEIYELP